MSTTFTPEQEARISKEMAQYEQGLKWVIDNYEHLRNKYADQYIAVLNGKVLGNSSDRKDLGNRMRSQNPQEFQCIFIDFIYKEHPNFVL